MYWSQDFSHFRPFQGSLASEEVRGAPAVQAMGWLTCGIGGFVLNWFSGKMRGSGIEVFDEQHVVALFVVDEIINLLFG